MPTRSVNSTRSSLIGVSRTVLNEEIIYPDKRRHYGHTAQHMSWSQTTALYFASCTCYLLP